MSFAAFLARRLVTLPIVLWLLVSLSFLLVRVAPGNPFSAERDIPPEVVKSLEEKYGMSGHPVHQYLAYLGRVVRGDLGLSTKYKDRTVNQIVADHLPQSLVIGASALCLALVFGLSSGLLAGIRQNSAIDYGAMSASMVGISLPTFVVGPCLMLVFALWWKLLPVSGWTQETALWHGPALAGAAGLSVAVAFLAPPQGLRPLVVGLAIAWAVQLAPTAAWLAAAPPGLAALAGASLLAAALLLAWAVFSRSRAILAIGGVAMALFQLAGGWHAVLPATTLALPFLARISRLTRTGMLEVIRQEYIKTAHAKGLPESLIVARHALRGALLPVVSYLGPAAADILVGSLVVERVFAVPGLGAEFVNSALNRDYGLVLGLVLVYGTLLVVFNLVVDLAYALLDPRIAYE